MNFMMLKASKTQKLLKIWDVPLFHLNITISTKQHRQLQTSVRPFYPSISSFNSNIFIAQGTLELSIIPSNGWVHCVRSHKLKSSQDSCCNSAILACLSVVWYLLVFTQAVFILGMVLWAHVFWWQWTWLKLLEDAGGLVPRSMVNKLHPPRVEYLRTVG